MAGSRGLDTGGFARADLERIGFVGFARVRDLLQMRPVAGLVPAQSAGVYVAFRDTARPVSFLRASPAGQFRGDLTWPLADLRERWLVASNVVYIGKAERPTVGSTNSLQRRVSAYLRYGAGADARHSGGYLSWQLADSATLLIAWRVSRAGASPCRLERRLIQTHIRRFGGMPFANLAIPTCDE